jgi:hypothetical protein
VEVVEGSSEQESEESVVVDSALASQLDVVWKNF